MNKYYLNGQLYAEVGGLESFDGATVTVAIESDGQHQVTAIIGPNGERWTLSDEPEIVQTALDVVA